MALNVNKINAILLRVKILINLLITSLIFKPKFLSSAEWQIYTERRAKIKHIRRYCQPFYKKSNKREDSVLHARFWLAACCIATFWLAATLSSVCLTLFVKQSEDKVAANQIPAFSTLSSLMFDFLKIVFLLSWIFSKTPLSPLMFDTCAI